MTTGLILGEKSGNAAAETASWLEIRIWSLGSRSGAACPPSVDNQSPHGLIVPLAGMAAIGRIT